MISGCRVINRLTIRDFLEVDALAGVFARGGKRLHAADAFLESSSTACATRAGVSACMLSTDSELSISVQAESPSGVLRSLVQIFLVLVLLLEGSIACWAAPIQTSRFVAGS